MCYLTTLLKVAATIVSGHLLELALVVNHRKTVHKASVARHEHGGIARLSCEGHSWQKQGKLDLSCDSSFFNGKLLSLGDEIASQRPLLCADNCFKNFSDLPPDWKVAQGTTEAVKIDVGAVSKLSDHSPQQSDDNIRRNPPFCAPYSPSKIYHTLVIF